MIRRSIHDLLFSLSYFSLKIQLISHPFFEFFLKFSLKPFAHALKKTHLNKYHVINIDYVLIWIKKEL